MTPTNDYIRTPNRVRFGNTTINLLQNDRFNNNEEDDSTSFPLLQNIKYLKITKNKKNHSNNKNGLPSEVATLPEALHKPLQYLFDTNKEYATIIQTKKEI